MHMMLERERETETETDMSSNKEPQNNDGMDRLVCMLSVLQATTALVVVH